MDNKTNVYRNYTSTQQKIQMISQLRITTREEAVAFLRAVASINEQIAGVLQRDSLNELAARNRKAPTPVEEQQAAVEVQATETVTETPNFEAEETHTEADVTARLKQLQKAKKK